MLTNIPFIPDSPIEDGCGDCTICLDACPTGAIVQGGQLNAQRCIAFLTQTKDFLPEEIVDRKKSPYPKTHNPTYLTKVKSMLTDIMKDKNAPINSLLNRNYILEILSTDGKAFTRPWFGQLMTRASAYGLFVPG